MTSIVCEMELLEPVTLKESLNRTNEDWVVTLNVAFASPPRGITSIDVFREAVVPGGAATVRLTDPEKPFSLFTVIVVAFESPPCVLSSPGLAPRAKSAFAGTRTSTSLE